MRDPLRGSAGATLKALRKDAEKLKRFGWNVEEPTNALEAVYEELKRCKGSEND